MANDREIFKRLCFGEQVEIPETLKPKLGKFRTSFTNKCRACDGDIAADDFDIHVGYWTPNLWFPIHKGCAQTYRSAEAYECQLIDRNCNDCRHFKRGQTAKVVADVSRLLLPRINEHVGFCEKNQAQVFASPNHCTGMPCFEHRKADV